MRLKCTFLHLKYYAALMLFLSFSLSSFAQSLLQKKISIVVQQMSIKDVLSTLETKSGVYFSYNSELLQEQKKVSISVQNQSLETVLNQVLGNGYRYQVSDNHVIIKAASGAGVVFTGRLVEAETGAPVEYASVYERSLKAGTITDEGGNFKLQIFQSLPKYELVISKMSYEDTVIHLDRNANPNAPIPLKRADIEVEGIIVYGVEQHWLAKRLISSRDKFNSINLRGYFSRQPYQFSLLPGLGSKNRMKGQSINKFSFNIIGGYAAGVKGFELGTGFNILQGDMEYVQIAGLFNAVGGKVRGIQISGAYNYVNKSVRGVQLSGIYNNAEALNGVQAVGAVNWVRGNVSGVQLAGFLNKNDKSNGAQASGFMNWNEGNFKGVQATGAFNKNDQIDGVQCAGFMNYTNGKTSGVQIAGAVNFTKDTVNGTQIAGLLNYAKVVNGTQLGLINIADSTSGLSLGLLSIIRKGKHTLDFSIAEWQLLNLAYKSGNNRLYNIFQVGGNLLAGKRQLSFGYGIGTSYRFSKKAELVQEFMFNTIYAGNWNEQTFLNRYQILFQYRLHPLLKIYAGPALNLLYHESNNSYEGYNIPFQTRYPSLNLNNHLKFWLGWTLGFSLF